MTYPEGEGTIWDGPWVTQSTEEELAKDFAEWELQVQDIIKVPMGPYSVFALRDSHGNST